MVRFGGAGFIGFRSAALAAQGQTWAIVFKMSSLAPAYTGLLGNGIAADHGGVLVKSSGKLGGYPFYSWNGYYDGSGAVTLGTSDFHYLLLVAGPKTFDVRIDGSDDKTGTAWNGVPGGWDVAMLGNQYVAGRVLTGDIAEVLLYPRRLTSAEIAALESYLATRYGL